MEVSDLPLVVPIENTINHMFREYFTELDEWKQRLAAEDAAKARAKAPPQTANAEQGAGAGASGAMSTKKGAQGKPAPKKGAPATGTAPAAEAGGGDGASPAAGTSSTPEPGAKPGDVGGANAGGGNDAPPADVWRQRAAALHADCADFIASCAPHHEWHRQRLAFLSAKPADQYMIEDLLGEWIDPVTPPATCIDSIKLAREHAASLAKAYGYKPPRGLHEVGKVVPRDQSAEAVRPLLAEHVAGGMEPPPRHDIGGTMGVGSVAGAGGTSGVAAGSAALGASLLRRTQQQQQRGEKTATILAPHTPPNVARVHAGRAHGHNNSNHASPGGTMTGTFAANTATATGTMRERSGSLPSMRESAGGSPTEGSSAAGPSPTKNRRRRPQQQQDGQHQQHDSVGGKGTRNVIPATVIEASTLAIAFPDCAPGATHEQRFTVWNRDTHGRRFKMAPAPSPLLTFYCATPSYHPDTPIVPGKPIDFVVRYSPVEAVPLEATIRIAHARDQNRIDTELNQASQWAYLDIRVTAGAAPPSLGIEQPFVIEPCFAFASQAITRQVTNKGCPGVFSLIVPEPFEVTPATFSLERDESKEVTVTVRPTVEGEYFASLVVEAILADDVAFKGTVFTAQYDLQAFCAVPKVWVEAVGTARLTATDGFDPANPNDVPSAVLEDACVSYCSQKQVCVRNDSPLPITFEWASAAMGDCEFSIFPPSGVLPAMRSTMFMVEVTPRAAESVECLFKLMLKDLPVVAPGHPLIPALSRTRLQPALLGGAVDDPDPFHVFPRPPNARSLRASVAATPVGGGDDGQQDGDVFAAAVRIAADPVEMAAHLVPDLIDGLVPGLIHQPTVREFHLVNDCNRELTFWLDPPTGDDHPAANLDAEGKKRQEKRLRKMRELFGSAYQPPLSTPREGIDLVFSPQRGTIAGNSTVTITMTFTLRHVGAHDVSIECHVPQLAAPPMLRLLATGRGPSVHSSAKALEFGIVPLGGEGESRLTLTNHCPIALNWRLVDPDAARRPPVKKLLSHDHHADGEESINDNALFTFIPPLGPLKPRESVDVTVYLRGTAPHRVATRVAVEVDSGETRWIDVHGCIEEPKACLAPSTLNFGDVDRDILRTEQVMLSNLCSVDIAWELVPVDVPAGVTVVLPVASGVVHAGVSNVPVTIRATFHGTTPTVALFALRSPQLAEALPLQLHCSSVSQVSVAVSVAVSSNSSKASAQSHSAAASPSTSPQLQLSSAANASGGGDAAVAVTPLTQSLFDFIGAVLDNVVSTAVGDFPTRIRPYAPRISLADCHIDDDQPYCMAAVRLTVKNTSGCETKVQCAATAFVPMFAGENTLTSTLVSTAAAERAAALVPLSTLGATKTKRSPLALVPAASAPSFQCKARDGRGAAEALAASELERTRRVLIDGKGMAIELRSASGALPGRATHEVFATIYSNLPGMYRDTLSLSCDGLPRLSLDVDVAVCGKPVLIDPFTAGLQAATPTASSNAANANATAPRVPTLTLPSLVGGMSSVSRRLKLTSRCPRDLLVTVALVESGSFYSLGLKETGADEAPYDVRVVPTAAAMPPPPDLKSTMRGHGSPARVASSTAQAANGASPFSVTTRAATPSGVVLCGLDEPSGASPSPGATSGACGAVTPSCFLLLAMQTEEIVVEYRPPAGAVGEWRATLVATSVVAPTLFNDKFYVDEYFQRERHRVASTRTIVADHLLAAVSNAGEMKGVPKIPVRSPLVDVPGVVRDSVLVQPDESEAAQLRRQSKVSSACVGSDAGSAVADIHGGDSDSDGDAKVDPAAQQRARAARERLGRAAAERSLVREFVLARRARAAEESERCFEPVEIDLVAHNVAARLTTDPPDVVRFPSCKEGGQCTRVVHLDNNGAAAMDFTLSVTPPFVVKSTTLVPHRTYRAAKLITTMGGSPAGGAAAAPGGGALGVSARALSDAPMSPAVGLGSLPRKPHPDNDPAAALFHLRPLDQLQVLIECPLDGSTFRRQVGGEFCVAFPSGAKQTLELLATVHVPTLAAEPPSTHFRPPVIVDNGRQQPSYVRRLALVNHSSCAASFTIEHVPSDKPISRSTIPLTRPERVQQTLGLLVTKEGGGVLDDPTRFVVSPMSGTVPAASAAGVPGRLELDVTFAELATTRFESVYRVSVAGGSGCDFTLRGDSKQTEVG